MKSANELPSEKARTAARKTPPTAPETGWRRWMPWAVTIFFAAWVIGNLKERPDKSPFHITEFGKLPVVLEGRVQPMDSVARNSLLLIRAKSTLAIEPEGSMSGLEKMFKTKRMPAIEWLLEAMTRPEIADTRKIFRIDNEELKGMLKLSPEEKHFTFAQIIGDEAAFDAFRKEAQRLAEAEENKTLEAEQRSAFEKAVVRAQVAINTYMRLKSSLQPENSPDFVEEVATYEQAIPGGVAALKESQTSESPDVQTLAKAFRRFDQLDQIAYPMIVPPADPSNKDGWQKVGGSLKEAMRTGSVSPAVKAYAKMATAYAKNQPDAFNAAVAEYRDGFLKGKFDKQLKKGSEESFFNHFEFFIKALTIYLVALLFGCAFWAVWSPWLRTTGFALATLAFIVHTTGLIFRMHLEGRPPVTNLYSSAIFVGFGSVTLGLILERIFRDGIGLVTASFVGFATLVIAHNLSLDGDTMKLLQAVLDTNIWLATHVVIITLGYASMFLAGTLATKYVLRGVFTKNLTPQAAKRFTQMVYGIVCFATLFSFVGTVLGGIWADQSWGRFWGWDPKENGALIIVIWCAIVLHARWGGMIRERGLMALALFGNVVTAYSWFGVNMLGVGLHSYGFMDQAFKWLVAYIVLQLALIGLTLMPARYWRSPVFGAPAKTASKPKESVTAEGQLAAAQKMLPREPAG
jgi:ABC-type transport system involved in cytochrome c biogenesis permease subunit